MSGISKRQLRAGGTIRHHWQLEKMKIFFLQSHFSNFFCLLTETTIITEGQRLMLKLYKECRAYERSLINKTILDSDNGTNCPVDFDGYLMMNANKSTIKRRNTFSYLCWGPARPNTTEWKNCPNYVMGYDGNLMASKVCLENGSWWRHPDSGLSWSDYRTCVNQNDVISRISCWLRQEIIIHLRYCFTNYSQIEYNSLTKFTSTAIASRSSL